MYTVLCFKRYGWLTLVFLITCLVLYDYTTMTQTHSKEKLRKYKESRNLFHKSSPFHKTKVRKILIVSYQRSGSTFTAEILKHGSDKAFFSMEPLWQKYKTCYRQRYRVCCRDSTCRSTTTDSQSISKTLSIFQSIYACNFTNIPYDVLRSFTYFPSTGQDYFESHRCFMSNSYKVEVISSPFYRTCVKKLTQLCLSSTIIIVKSIRIDTEIAEMLRKSLTGLRIVHLIRDPRAILTSRAFVGSLSSTSIQDQAGNLCGRMMNNTNYLVSNNMASSIHILLYEHLVRDPNNVVRCLFKFSGLSFSRETENWLYNFTNGYGEFQLHSSILDVKFLAIPKLSYNVSRKWRTRLPIDIVRNIQIPCLSLLNHYGYQKFDTIEEVRNVSKEDILEVKLQPLMNEC